MLTTIRESMNPTEITISTACITAIVTLWRYFQSSMSKFETATNGSIQELKVKVEECETDREAIKDTLSTHAQQLAVFRACPQQPCPAKDGLTRSEEYGRVGR